MSWYILIFIITGVFVLTKAVLTLLFGDIDYDFDGDVDFDISSMLSFKGIIHFLLGFSARLCIVSQFTNGYHFTSSNWLGATICGFSVLLLLWVLYKYIPKLNWYSSENPDIEGCKCSILSKLDDDIYEVLVKTPSGTIKTDLKSWKGINLSVGKEYNIIKFNNQYFIFSL